MTTPENFISELKRITLTPNERSAMRSRLHAYAQSHSPMPGFFTQSVQWLGRHSVAALVGVVALIGGAASVSAHFAGPSDALYGFRVQVNDRVQVALTRDDEKRLDVEMEQLQRMIDAEDGVRDEELINVDVEEIEPEPSVEQPDKEESEELRQLQEDDSEFERELEELLKELNEEDGSRLDLE